MSELKHSEGCISLKDPLKECDCGAKQEALKARQAVSPIFNNNPAPPEWMKSLSKDKAEKTTKIDAPEKGEDTVMAEFSQSSAWKYLKKFIETRQAGFAELLADRIAAGSYDMEEIGYRYLVFAQVKDAYQDIITRVENLGTFVEKPRPEAPIEDDQPDEQ